MTASWTIYAEKGAAAFQAGDFPEAEKMLRAALLEAETSADPLERAVLLDNLAEIYFEQSKFAEAEPLYLEALSLREDVLIPGHEDIVASMNNLSALYFFMGAHHKAEPICRKVTAMYAKALGPSHPEVATSLNNLGLCLSAQKRYADAEMVFKKALEIREKLLAENDPEIGATLHQLGFVYRETGKWEAAA
ncbi:MAG TPA: tetratricopeptide repeat protein, partial [Candidatus Obscuribacterales bacterium]